MRRSHGIVGRRIVFGTMLIAALGVLSIATAYAADSSIARGFRAGDTNIVAGAIVSLQEGEPTNVELSTLSNRGSLVGVVGTEALLELVNGDPVQVVTSGVTSVLVTDLNGAIQSGDKITPSPIEGVGMKATESATIAGTAQIDFAADTAESRTIKMKTGEERTVRVGSLSILVAPGFYEVAEGQNTSVPRALQALANNVAGRNVSALRLMISGLVIVAMLTAIGVIGYSSVRSSIISIGRNPLSEQAVHKSLFQVGVTSFGVLAFSIILVYLILTT